MCRVVCGGVEVVCGVKKCEKKTEGEVLSSTKNKLRFLILTEVKQHEILKNNYSF